MELQLVLRTSSCDSLDILNYSMSPTNCEGFVSTQYGVLCHKKILMFRLRSTQCDSCKRRFCSKCCPKDNRGNITNDEGDILKKNARFCLQCKPMNLVFM